MRSRYKIYEPDAACFITSTIVEWLSIFTSAAYFEILISSLRFSQQEKFVFRWRECVEFEFPGISGLAPSRSLALGGCCLSSILGVAKPELGNEVKAGAWQRRERGEYMFMLERDGEENQRRHINVAFFVRHLAVFLDYDLKNR